MRAISESPRAFGRVEGRLGGAGMVGRWETLWLFVVRRAAGPVGGARAVDVDAGVLTVVGVGGAATLGVRGGGGGERTGTEMTISVVRTGQDPQLTTLFIFVVG